MSEIILVSACLAGLRTRYDAQACPEDKVIALVKEGRALPLCPEQLGGLPTPRPRAEIQHHSGKEVLKGICRVLTHDGLDVTEQFIRGAEQVLKVVELAGIKKAIMKDRSPSCGVKVIIREGKPVRGEGVTTALLRSMGVEVISSDSL